MTSTVFLKETIKAGEPLTINFSWFENGAEYSVEAYSVSIVMRRDKPDGAKVAEWLDGDAAIVQAGNQVSLTLSAAFTGALKSELNYIDCWLTNNAGDGLKSGIIELKIDHGVKR